eukprot:Polyplicarium_translucidae@DN3280_c0_g2_i6.p1
MKTPTNAERPEEPSTKAEEFHDASPGVECAQLPGSVRKFIATQEGLVVFHNIHVVVSAFRARLRSRADAPPPPPAPPSTATDRRVSSSVAAIMDALESSGISEEGPTICRMLYFASILLSMEAHVVAASPSKEVCIAGLRAFRERTAVFGAVHGRAHASENKPQSKATPNSGEEICLNSTDDTAQFQCDRFAAFGFATAPEEARLRMALLVFALHGFPSLVRVLESCPNEDTRAEAFVDAAVRGTDLAQGHLGTRACSGMKSPTAKENTGDTAASAKARAAMVFIEEFSSLMNANCGDSPGREVGWAICDLARHIDGFGVSSFLRTFLEDRREEEAARWRAVADTNRLSVEMLEVEEALTCHSRRVASLEYRMSQSDAKQTTAGVEAMRQAADLESQKKEFADHVNGVVRRHTQQILTHTDRLHSHGLEFRTLNGVLSSHQILLNTHTAELRELTAGGIRAVSPVAAAELPPMVPAEEVNESVPDTPSPHMAIGECLPRPTPDMCEEDELIALRDEVEALRNDNVNLANAVSESEGKLSELLSVSQNEISKIQREFEQLKSSIVAVNAHGEEMSQIMSQKVDEKMRSFCNETK